ncbi:helix-turn-helix transcriptional regulator [Streptomyces sp. NPDC001581]|uniref:helix-turn-helix domain-containing protein n=1 Tax=Streptomyces sp. NPDC001581 TaxID=3154386 RepID=UPI00331B4278
MMKKMGFVWNLRRLMAERDMFQTTDLVPQLAEYGVHLSREQVFRLVTQPPQRLSMETLAALCGILGCSPADLIEVRVVHRQTAKPVASGEAVDRALAPPSRSVRVRRPEGL